MKTEIIPTILVKTFKEVKERIEAVEKYVNWVQLDIMDGIFVNNKTWNNAEDLKDFETKAKIEAHLMVDEPEKIIDKWLKFTDRVIVHYEASENLREIIKKIRKKKKEIGIALNPETNPAVLEPFLQDLNLVLFMTVQPGWGGQKFEEQVLGKIKILKKIWPKGNIEVDGGINNENIVEVVESGANLICVGTYIFGSKNTKEAISNLKKKI